MTTDTQLAPTDAEIEALGHRMCWRYKHDTGVNHVSTWKFNAQTLHDFARAVLAKWGQPTHSGEPVAWLNPWRADQVTTDYDAYGEHGIAPYTAPQPVERKPLTHAQAKALVLKYGSDPLHLVLQVERAHGIKGDPHGTE